MKKIEQGEAETMSQDIKEANLRQLQELFPEAFSEGRLDPKLLEEMLPGGAIEEREEKYGLNWHGKRRARQLALTPSTGTLRPCPDKSVDWDRSNNIMIEGDNLEVLKLLQKSYAGKVKLIYIDPPYNTGEDFIYPDDYRENITNYLMLTGQRSSDGRKLTSNSEASGRFHTDWLNMMYPRLKLARDLLSQSGTVWISIDDHEFHNLRASCDSIFGVENFVGTFVWEKRTTRENRKVFSVNHDYIVCYAKDKNIFETVRCTLPRSDANEERFTNPDNDTRGPWQSVSLNAQAGPGRRREQFYTITTPSGRKVDPPSGRCWVYTKERYEELKADNRIWFGSNGDNVPRIKCFRSESDDGIVPHTMWRADEVGTTDTAKKAIKELFDGVEVFDTPKPVALLQRIVQISTDPTGSDIVLDFFAGAGPTGEAVYDQNVVDGGNRRFITVQLPEKIPSDSPAKELKFNTLDEVTEDRLRRAGRKIRSNNQLFKGDTGFRVFKLDSSNITAWDPDLDNLDQALLNSMEHTKPGRSDEDLIYELLLKLGLDLCVPIEQKTIGKKVVHSIGAGALIVCLAFKISRNDAEPLALGIIKWHKQLNPSGESTIVFRDSAFEDDVAKTNLAAILQQHGLENVRSL